MIRTFGGTPRETNLYMPDLKEEHVRGVPSFKYCTWDFAWLNCESDYVRAVLALMPVDRNKALFDVKVQRLQRGQVPCIPGWHLDGTNIDIVEEFYLFVSGVSYTQFISEFKQEVNTSNCGELTATLGAELNNTPRIHYSVSGCRIHSYTNRHFHRGQPATEDGLRLLVRAANVNIKPRNVLLAQGESNGLI